MWEALEVELWRVSDWHARLEERTKAEASHAASERSQLQTDLETYKRNVLKIYNREVAGAGWEKIWRRGIRPWPMRRPALPGCSRSSRSGARTLSRPLSACTASTKSWRRQPRG